MKKSMWIKALSVFLAVLTAVMSLPITAFTSLAEVFEKDSKSNDGISSNIRKDTYELVELRQENVKHFQGEDGLTVAVQYDVPVHIKDSDGKWQDIDNTLSSAGSEYTTSNARIKFAKKDHRK